MSAHLAELIDALPDGVVVTDPDADREVPLGPVPGPRAPVRRSRSSAPRTPTRCRPPSAGPPRTGCRWCRAAPGSGLSGGSSAVDGGIVLSLERMAAVEIDPTCQVAVVEPGAFNADVKAAAAEHGLWYPPDPSSYEFCSIGGNVATNAGGLCCVKYGVTTDYVLGLDVVLADGTLVTLGGKRIKDVAGLSLLKLFVGSEGTLGIVTRAILRLVPAQAARSTLVATLRDARPSPPRRWSRSGRALRPSMLELMDQPSIRAVEEHRSMGLDVDAGALLVAQSDAPGTSRSEEIALMEKACHDSGATGGLRHRRRRRGRAVRAGPPDGDPGGRGARRADARGRRRARAAAARAARRPWPRSPSEHDLSIPVIAHAGDGNTHPLIVVPRDDDAAHLRALQAFDEIMHAAIAPRRHHHRRARRRPDQEVGAARRSSART